MVGMSGGVDSTLTALKLKDRGFEVVGVTLFMWDSPTSRKSVEDAKQQALHIGIDHHVVDCRIEFKQLVVQPFISSYINGETPSPCAWCNPNIKWKFIADFADKIGAQLISSGHYVEVVESNGHFYISKGADPQKDQSYYLWMLPESIIRRMVQPLGGITKVQTRQEIAERNFEELVPTKESMSVCFLAGVDYRQFLFEHAPEQLNKISVGDVVDECGKKVGTHLGYPFYTVGQKRGLMMTEEREAYVSKIDHSQNRLTIGRKNELLKKEFTINMLHFINKAEITPSTAVEVKVRGLGINPEGFGYISFKEDQAKVTLENPAWAMSPGQPVVFYINNRLVGGGVTV